VPGKDGAHTTIIIQVHPSGGHLGTFGTIKFFRKGVLDQVTIVEISVYVGYMSCVSVCTYVPMYSVCNPPASTANVRRYE